MKKVLSICLSVLMLLGMMPMMAQAADAWTGTGGENVEFSFGLISDVHDEYETLNLDQSVNAALDLGAQFIAFNGDITSIVTGDGKTLDSYDKYYELVKPVYDDLKDKGIEFTANMGNHEYAGDLASDELTYAQQAFENYVGPRNNHVVSEQGFHFVSISPESFKNDFSSTSVDYLIAETEAAIAADSTNDVDGVFAEGVVPNSTKPVFVLAHWKNSTLNRFLEYAKTRPQIIFTYGHFHTAVEYPANIQQDGFTSYMSPVSYGNAKMYGKTSISPHQSTHVEVETGEKGSVVKIYKLSLDKKEFIGEPWVIDIGAIVSDLSDEDTTNDLNNFLYSADKRANPSLPYFAEGATLEAQPVFTSAKLIFPKALIDETPNQQDDFIFAYNIDVYDESEANVYSTTIYADFVNNATPASSYSQIVTGLEEGTTYTAKVTPVSALSNVQNGSTMPASLPKGEPLTVTFSTVEDTLGTETKTEETIKFDEKTVIEYEAWKSLVPKHTMTELYGTSGSRIIYNTGGKINGVADPFTFSIPVNVEKAGTYKVEYVAATGGIYAGNVQFTMEKNGAIGDTSSGGTSLGTSAWEHHTLKKFTKTVTLKSGTDNLLTTINVAAAGSQHLYELDCITFECIEVFEVKLDDAATIEYEDFTDYAVLEDSGVAPASLATLEDADAYSNGKALSVTDEAENFDVSLPLAVQKTGKFDVEFKASKGAVLYITDTAGEVVKTIDTSSYEGEDAIATITENSVILEAGDYTVTAKVLATDGVATGILDSVKFTKTAYYNPVTMDKGVTLEAEDYREIYKVDTEGTVTTYSLPDSTVKTATLAYSGDGYVQYNASGSAYAYSAIEIDVKEAGTYSIEYYVRRWNWNSNNGAWVTLDGKEYAVTRKSDTWTDFERHYIGVTLTEGTHTVGYKVEGRPDLTSKNCYFAYDYIKVTPANADISATEKTVLQGEEIHTVRGTSTTYLCKILDNATAVDGKYLECTNGGAGVTSTITLNVEETGFYDVTAHVLWKVNDSGYTLKIGSTTVGTIARATTGTEAWKTITGKVKLTKGTQTLTLSSAGGSYVDYISFEPYDPTVTVPAEGVLIEAESNPYVTKFVETTTTTTSTDEEGNETTTTEVIETKDTISVSATTKISYNYSTTNTSTVKYSKVTWDQPINVQKAGQYVISYTINQSAWYHGKLYPMLDGKQLDMTFDVARETPVLVKVSYIMDLTKGAHTLGVMATKHSNDNCTLAVDCVSVYPLENAFEAADVSEPKTTIELENYTANTFIANTGYPLTSYTSASDALSGGNSLYMTRQSSSASSNLYVVFPIDVKVAGTYNLEFSATGKDTSYSSGITLSVDGVAKTTTSHSDNTVFKTYTVSNVNLTEGKHIIKFEIKTYGVNARGKIDYISFSPAESAVYDVEELTTTVTTNIETVGEAIIALYDVDGKLTGVHTETITAAKTLRDIEIAVANTPVLCRVYVWEDLINVNPLTAPREIAIQ